MHKRMFAVLLPVLLAGCLSFACKWHKSPATGPLIVKASFINKDGTAAAVPSNLHLVTIERDNKGELSSVVEHFGNIKMSPAPGTKGGVGIEVPRDLVAKGGEFSFAFNAEGGFPAPLRKGEALLTFKVDAATEQIDIGEIVLE